MTNEKRYQATIELLKAYGAAINTDMRHVIEAPWDYYTGGDPLRGSVPAIHCAAALLIECMEKMQESKPSQSAAIKKVFKAAQRNGKGRFDGVFENGGKFCLLDGHRLFRLNDDLPDYPHLAPDAFDAAKLIPDASQMHAAPVPSVAELKAKKAEMKTAKTLSAKDAFWYGGYICFNPDFMLDALAILDDPVLYLPESNRAPLYLEGTNGDAIILPVNPGVAMTYSDNYKA